MHVDLGRGRAGRPCWPERQGMRGRNGFSAGFVVLGVALCGVVVAVILEGGAFSYRNFPEPPAPRVVERGGGGPGPARPPGFAVDGLADGSVRRLVPVTRLGAGRPAVTLSAVSGAPAGAPLRVGSGSPSLGRPGAGRGGRGESARQPRRRGRGLERRRPARRAPRPGPRPLPRPGPQSPPPPRPGPQSPAPPRPAPSPVAAPARDSALAGAAHPARPGPRKPRPGRDPSPAAPAGEEATGEGGMRPGHRRGKGRPRRR